MNHTCSDRLLDPLFDLDNIGGLRFVAPRPASKLFNKEGLLAQMKAWNEDTVNTPSLFRVFFVALDTCVSKDWKWEKYEKIGEKSRVKTINRVKVVKYTKTFTGICLYGGKLLKFVYYMLMLKRRAKVNVNIHIFFPSKYIFILKNKMKKMNQNKTREITNEFSHALVYYAGFFLDRGYLENGTFK